MDKQQPVPKPEGTSVSALGTSAGFGLQWTASAKKGLAVQDDAARRLLDKNGWACDLVFTSLVAADDVAGWRETQE